MIECFECKKLLVLIELAKQPEYRGPKPILCEKCRNKHFALIKKLLK